MLRVTNFGSSVSAGRRSGAPALNPVLDDIVACRLPTTLVRCRGRGRVSHRARGAGATTMKKNCRVRGACTGAEPPRREAQRLPALTTQQPHQSRGGPNEWASRIANPARCSAARAPRMAARCSSATWVPQLQSRREPRIGEITSGSEQRGTAVWRTGTYSVRPSRARRANLRHL